jgi:hypothetical protein
MKIVWRDPAIDGVNSLPAEWLRQKGRELEVMAKSSVGVDTGALQTEITVTDVKTLGSSTLEIQVGANPGGTDEGYAKIHHNGAPPHIIKPKRKGGMLRFISNGKVVYAKQVNHPGTKPNHYLTRWLRILFP